MQLHNDLTEIKCLVTFYEWAAGFAGGVGSRCVGRFGLWCGATFLVEIKNQLRFFFFFDVLFPCSGPALEKMNSVCPYRTARG